MDLINNKRITRICDVLERNLWMRDIQEEALKSEDIEYQGTGLEKFKREAYRCVAYNPSYLPFEKRLEKLKKWDDYLYVTEGMREFLQFIECVHSVENSLNELEDKLYEQGIEINEKMFYAFCEGNLATTDLDIVRELELTPICSSTPEREMIATKAFVKVNPMTYTPRASELPAYVKQILNKNDSNEMIIIGSNGTTIPKKALLSINWSQTGANITRKLLMEIFDRQTLASHTLSGKPSPAFLGCNKPLKQQLDEKKVRDLTEMVTNTFNMSEKEVRQAITTKCADENKMYRQRLEKLRKKLSKENGKK